MLARRDEEFRPLHSSRIREGDEPLWSVNELREYLGYESETKFRKVVNLAITAASNHELPVSHHFVEGDLFDHAGDTLVTKYAAILILFNADPKYPKVGVAQSYFALQVDKQALEDEKRVRGRLEVTQETRRLGGAAKDAGVGDFQKFHGMGISALYGGLSVREICARKGLKVRSGHLDFAGSEELAANLFRITQTAASLRRQGAIGESAACQTHQRIGKAVRATIEDAGNTPPEDLAPAELSIDRTATQVKRRVKAGKKTRRKVATKT